jgi:hypothetical protein
MVNLTHIAVRALSPLPQQVTHLRAKGSVALPSESSSRGHPLAMVPEAGATTPASSSLGREVTRQHFRVRSLPPATTETIGWLL